MSEDLYPPFDPSPRERGILAGLADRWSSNPYRVPRTAPIREYTEYAVGFSIGQRLLALAEKDPTGD